MPPHTLVPLFNDPFSAAFLLPLHCIRSSSSGDGAKKCIFRPERRKRRLLSFLASSCVILESKQAHHLWQSSLAPRHLTLHSATTNSSGCSNALPRLRTINYGCVRTFLSLSPAVPTAPETNVSGERAKTTALYTKKVLFLSPSFFLKKNFALSRRASSAASFALHPHEGGDEGKKKIR